MIALQGRQQAGVGEKAQHPSAAGAIDAADQGREPTLRQHPLQRPVLEEAIAVTHHFGDALDEVIHELRLGDQVQFLDDHPLDRELPQRHHQRQRRDRDLRQIAQQSLLRLQPARQQLKPAGPDTTAEQHHDGRQGQQHHQPSR